VTTVLSEFAKDVDTSVPGTIGLTFMIIVPGMIGFTFRDHVCQSQQFNGTSSEERFERIIDHNRAFSRSSERMCVHNVHLHCVPVWQ
jgi:hypothetical protein